METIKKVQQDALVIMSGGQDSTTCLFWALKKYRNVSAVSFYYDQRHSDELICAQRITSALGVPHVIHDLTILGKIAKESSLIGQEDKSIEVLPDGIPNTHVPMRNAMFLTIAYGISLEQDINNIVIGACEVDSSGYRDCTGKFLDQLEQSLNTGYKNSDTGFIRIVAPLLTKTKAEIFELADRLGILDVIIKDTHTCYKGDHNTLHPWGFGCGECPACILRKNGYEQFMEKKNGK